MALVLDCMLRRGKTAAVDSHRRRPPPYRKFFPFSATTSHKNAWWIYLVSLLLSLSLTYLCVSQSVARKYRRRIKLDTPYGFLHYAYTAAAAETVPSARV